MAGENKSYKGWYLFAIIVIVFALSAPYLFTRNGIIDFTETGQIGDTIGGTMGPFIALAGVIVTFLAFLMQKKANDIISEQHEDDKKREGERLRNEYYARVELLKSDLMDAKQDIAQRISFLKKHRDLLQENPFRTSRLEDCPAEMYSRMSNSNRDRIFLALTNLEIASPEKILHAYYTVPDYLTPSIKLIREITDSHSNDTYKQLTVIRDAAEYIYSVSRQNGWLGFYPIDCMIDFANEVTKCLNPKGESNFEQLRPIFTSLELNLQRLIRSNACKQSETELLKFADQCRIAITAYTYIETGAKQIIASETTVIEEYQKMIQRCDNVLKDLKNLSDQASQGIK